MQQNVSLPKLYDVTIKYPKDKQKITILVIVRINNLGIGIHYSIRNQTNGAGCTYFTICNLLVKLIFPAKCPCLILARSL